MRNLWRPGLVLLILLSVISTLEVTAQQISFENVTDLLTQRQKGTPICKGFTDVDGDFRDDIIRAANGDELMVDINSNFGEFFQNVVIDTTDGESTWAIVVADVDNNGQADIMSAGSYNGFKIFEAGEAFGEYNLRQTSETDYFAQGANFVDINNDGWLDAFICDDDAESEVYINDGTGQLVRDTNLIDMKTTPVSDNSGNYASEWVDIDGDKDLDLYIAKCRLNVDDGIIESTDPRRINMLFINELNEGGTFREASEEWGVKVGRQTWTSNFGDIDNDGDQDLFLANHEAPSQLFENVGGRFEEIPIFANGEDLLQFAFQTSMADFNNDGFLDILLVGNGERLLYNNGDKTFTSRLSPFGTTRPISFALGDYNEDGYLDAFASYRGLGPGQTGDRDILWVNSGADNNYFALTLVGQESNRSAAGARITIEGAWGKQCRVIQSGVGYGITNSLTARFGLGEATAIDRIIIEWPSGLVDTYDGSEVSINEQFIVTEGQCIQRLAKTVATDTRLDCALAGITLSVDEPFDEIVWSPNGETTAEIEATTPGSYHATLTRDGCQNVSQTIIVRGPEVLVTPVVNVEEDIVLCVGEAVELRVLNDDPFEWSSGENGDFLEITESGTFFASNTSDCESVESSPIDITFVDSNAPAEAIVETFISPQVVELQAPNETTVWYSDPEGTNVIANGDIFVTDLLDSDTTFYFDHDVDVAPPGYIGGAQVTATEEKTDFSFENVNGALFFVINDTSLFRSVKVNARLEGPRHIQIFDFVTKELVVEDTIDIAEGVSEVDLNFPMGPGSYQIEVNAASSTATFGSNNPELAIITGEIDYPFTVSNLATISRSLFGREFYHYFFDWKIEPIVETCRSAITPYNLIFNLSSVNEPLDFELDIFPNPVSGILTVSSEEKINTVSLLDYTGRRLMTRDVNSGNINLDMVNYENGTYLLELSGDDFQTIRQIVKVQ